MSEISSTGSAPNVFSLSDKIASGKLKASLTADDFKTSGKFTVQRLDLPEVLIIRPKSVFTDNRGSLFESYRYGDLAELANCGLMPVQASVSHSIPYVLRGLHYQVKEPQGKFLTVTAGKIFDVAVDLRRSSKNFGKWCGIVLEARNPGSIYIPPKFAHGFLALEAGASVLYLCTTYHDSGADRAIRWNDPAIGIQWPIGHGANLFMSTKDKHAPALSDAETFA